MSKHSFLAATSAAALFAAAGLLPAQAQQAQQQEQQEADVTIVEPEGGGTVTVVEPEGEGTTEATQTTTEAVGDAAEGAAETVQDAAQATGEAMQDTAETAGEAVEGAAEATGEALQDAAGTTGETAGEATVTVEQPDTTETTVTVEQPDATEQETVRSADLPPAADGTPVEGQIFQQSPDSFLASTFMDATVISANGETIGDVSDLVIGSDGSIEGVVVGVGGFLGIGRKSVALEFSAIEISQEEDLDLVFVANATQEQLEAAPAFRTRDEVQREEEAQAAAETAPAAGGGGMTPPPLPGDAPPQN